MTVINSEFLHKELLRVSEWVRFADQKSAFLSVFYTAIVGYLVTNKDSIYNALSNYHSCYFLLLLLLLICIIISLVIGLYALYQSIFPNLKNFHTKETLFYFGTISNKKIIDFISQIKELTEDQMITGLSEQIYTNSVIANKKMSAVSTCVNALFFTSMFILILIIFVNLA